MHGNHIGIALHEINVLLLVDGVFGEIDAIKGVALMVDGVLAGIDVFARVFAVFFQDSASEADDLAGVVVDRENDTSAVDVVEFAALRLARESQFDQVFLFIALLQRRFREIVPTIGTVAEPELVDGGIHETAFLEVGHTHELALLGIAQLLHEILLGELIDNHEAFA